MTNLNPSQFHPNLHNYRDGGLGGDENHSVVGMVPVEHLKTLREWDRRNPAHSNPDSGKIIDGIREDLRSGHGLENPVTVEYSRAHEWAYLGEGNHRLQAAIEEGHTHVPTRVVRSNNGPKMRKEDGIGGHVTVDRIPDVPDRDWHAGYIPSDIHPKYIFGENNERAPLSAGQFKDHQIDEITKLLGH